MFHFFFFKLTSNFGLFLGKLNANKGCQGTSPTWLNDVVWFLMWEDNRGTFSLEEALLWIMDSYFDQKRRFKVKNVIKWWICFLQTCSFSLQDIHCWTGVVWITCGLLWCFYELFGLSFWRHPFTAEDPWWASDAMLNFSKSVLMKRQTHLHREWPEGEYTFSVFRIIHVIFHLSTKKWNKLPKNSLKALAVYSTSLTQPSYFTIIKILGLDTVLFPYHDKRTAIGAITIIKLLFYGI